ncbi:FAD-dependent oxidoreductase [Capsulimonas corticalis]|uniref:FAD-dependent oxidoreductase n=1 Tax=Capsulimonas corticalis TaxID=2219043 RepID=A0A402D0U8_9BACT|nr:FAD-dependent oxidoreductase [Capsulimonas corticalis]BDI33488.1 FAD-dependent oxidoreductase [Capsulimonas corticalis]
MTDITYDILIVGGSLGGVAAALSAASRGLGVCLLEATSWLGGQYTAQGVTKPDENEFIETVGSTPSYRAFRHAVRAYYRGNARLSARGAAQPEFNPGGAYPGFTMEPLVGNFVLGQLLSNNPNIHVRLNTTITALEMDGDAVASVTAKDPSGVETRYLAGFYLDATDLGDLLPLSGQQEIDWTIGAESKAETGEPEAPDVAHPEWIQSITMPFAMEHRPRGEDHTIDKPEEYDKFKTEQDYTIVDGYISTMFVAGKDFWSYRSIIDADNFADPGYPFDVTMVNMVGNDYQAATIPTGDPAKDAAIVARARQASLGYLYWLQTECPRDGEPGRFGYPEFKLRADLFNTSDGTSAQAYIRESRRIKALKTVVQQEVDAQYAGGPRAALFKDSCGVGYYGGMDVHACAGVGTPEKFLKALPYQIPVSALIPRRLTNLLPACKNIGVTHLTNGAYRLHPSEWAIGEAAAALAAFCLQNSIAPAAVPADPAALKAFQHGLLGAGVPLFWWTDITEDSPYFAAVHLLGINGLVSGYSDMSYRPNNLLTDEDRQDLDNAVGQALPWPDAPMTRGQAARWLVQQLGL